MLLIAATFLCRCAGREGDCCRLSILARRIPHRLRADQQFLFSLNAHIAEHWLYFSSAFLFAAAALSLTAIPVSRGLLVAVFSTWLGFIGARTYARNFDWKDQRTFLQNTAMDGGDSARIKINMGILESSEGRQQIAIAYFQNGLAERPDQPFALLGLATAYMRAHDFVNARAQLQRARIDPFVHAEALKDIAALEYQENGTVDLGLLGKAASMEPDNWDIQSTYIKVLADNGKMPDAIAKLHAVLDDQPYRSESWGLMGDLLKRDGHADLAQSMYDQARAYDVHYDENAAAAQKH